MKTLTHPLPNRYQAVKTILVTINIINYGNWMFLQLR